MGGFPIAPQTPFGQDYFFESMGSYKETHATASPKPTSGKECYG